MTDRKQRKAKRDYSIKVLIPQMGIDFRRYSNSRKSLRKRARKQRIAQFTEGDSNESAI